MAREIKVQNNMPWDSLNIAECDAVLLRFQGHVVAGAAIRAKVVDEVVSQIQAEGGGVNTILAHIHERRTRLNGLRETAFAYWAKHEYARAINGFEAYLQLLGSAPDIESMQACNEAKAIIRGHRRGRVRRLWGLLFAAIVVFIAIVIGGLAWAQTTVTRMETHYSARQWAAVLDDAAKFDSPFMAASTFTLSERLFRGRVKDVYEKAILRKACAAELDQAKQLIKIGESDKGDELLTRCLINYGKVCDELVDADLGPYLKVYSEPHSDVVVKAEGAEVVRKSQLGDAGIYAFAQLASGKYQVVLSKPYYQDMTRILTVGDSLANEIRAPLEPQPGGLRFVGQKGVEIYSANNKVAETGDQIDGWSPGEHMMDLRHPDYETTQFKAIVLPGRISEVQLPTLTLKRSALLVRLNRSSESGTGEEISGEGQVLIDNVATNVTFPALVSQLPVGEHLVRVKYDNWTPLEEAGKTVKVIPGMTNQLSITLSPHPATWFFNVEPRSSKVAISSKEYGFPGASSVLLTPFTSYQAKISSPGYASEVFVVPPLNPGQKFTNQLIRLKKPVQLVLEVVPTNSSILIGGRQFTGSSTINIDPNTPYDVQISAPGYSNRMVQISPQLPESIQRQVVVLDRLSPFVITAQKYEYRGQAFVRCRLSNNDQSTLPPMHRNILIMVDVSSSMNRYQGVISAALTTTLSKISDSDLINVFVFAENVKSCFTTLVKPTAENIDAIPGFLKNTRGVGVRTDLGRALASITSLCNQSVDNNPFQLLIITDADPTAGVQNNLSILDKILGLNYKGLTVNGIIVGQESKSLIDLLSFNTGGTMDFIDDRAKMADMIERSLLSDRITFYDMKVVVMNGTTTVEAAPLNPPALVLGGHSDVYIRVQDRAQPVSLTVSGNANGMVFSNTMSIYADTLPEGDATIVRGWADNYIYSLYWTYIKNYLGVQARTVLRTVLPPLLKRIEEMTLYDVSPSRIKAPDLYQDPSGPKAKVYLGFE